MPVSADRSDPHGPNFELERWLLHQPVACRLSFVCAGYDRIGGGDSVPNHKLISDGKWDAIPHDDRLPATVDERRVKLRRSNERFGSLFRSAQRAAQERQHYGEFIHLILVSFLRAQFFRV